MNCPCGKGLYAVCCGKFHEGKELAGNAEELMRSRYSAFVLKNEPYLLSTWHPSTRPQEPLFNQDKTQWVGLTVKHFNEANDQLSATVEFLATYKINGKAHRLHEISDFVYEDKQWLYVDGQFPKINGSMNDDILLKMRAVFQDCQKQAVILVQQHPSIHKGFVADMQFASTFGTFLGEIKIKHGIDIEKDSIAQRLINALEKTDSHTIGLIREEIYDALDKMQAEQYASYIFISCFPSIYKAMSEK